jgi:hypothetical protein
LTLPHGFSSPTYLSIQNVAKVLEMVRDAKQRLPSGDESGKTGEHFRQRRRELIKFLERAVEVGEAVWCDV